MKKILVLFFASAISLGTFAQANQKMDKMDKMKSEKMAKMKDGVMMKDGKMMVCKKGETMPMTEDMKMGNGTMVMKDGTVKTKDGKTMMMKDGEMIDKNGKISMMKMDEMEGDKMKDGKE